MDELLNLATNFQISNVYSTSSVHPRFAQYKIKRNPSSQAERRKQFLESLKQKRHDAVSQARCFAENVCSSCSEEEEEADEMDWRAAPRKKHPRRYKNQLMLSEWLVEVPDDLADEWQLVLCPVGKRSLVIASCGYTKTYSRKGILIKKFPSLLPGGNRKNTGPSGYTILDCIFNIEEKIYYIIDIMCWKGHPVFDSETEFRHYWLHDKTEEVPEIRVKSPINPCRFIALPYYPCSRESLQSVITSPLPFACKLDGLLFYHKKTPYTSGITPLVGWLKAYMLPEILNISVPDSLCRDKPESYVSMKNHLSAAIKRHEKRKKENAEEMVVEPTCVVTED